MRIFGSAGGGREGALEVDDVAERLRPDDLFLYVTVFQSITVVVRPKAGLP